MKIYSLILSMTLLLFSCAKDPLTFDESQENFFTAAAIEGFDKNSLSIEDQDLYHHVGLSLLVEQYSVESLSSMKTAIRLNPPAGIVFWNGNRVDATTLARVTQDYFNHASIVSPPQPPLLMSTDYEGGGLRKTISGRSIPGIQRFRAGFTDLPHGQWLGHEMQEQNSTRLCELQGEIMGKELLAVGINYPLATVADLAGGLFVNRGISTNPEATSLCLKKLTSSFHRATNNNAVFVTKHFPGLGFTRGDTHDITVTSSRRGALFNEALSPFRSLTQEHEKISKSQLLSIMVSHAQFTAYSQDRTTTESSFLLTEVLKKSSQFTETDGGVKFPIKGVGLKGFALSDAMWMGVYGFIHQMASLGRIPDDESGEKLHDLKQFLVDNRLYPSSQVHNLTRADYQRTYNVLNLSALFAGIDLLMVPNVQFAKIVEYLRRGVAGLWSEEELRLIQVRLNLLPSQASSGLKARLKEIVELNRNIRSKLQIPTPLNSVLPKDLTAPLSAEMLQVLRGLDGSW